MPDSQSVLPPVSRYALQGKIVTMDRAFQVQERGAIYIDADQIVAVQPVNAPPPPGFESSPVLDTRGTVYPGLIELHNHLSYNVLPIWGVPKKYTNRGQWSGIPEYRKGISGPLHVLGRTPGYIEAIVRYVECKCLLAGVTTSQGIALFSNNNIQRYYRGIVRNVEETGDSQLPDAATKISDVEARDAGAFLERLRKSSCVLLHLSEGIDQNARDHFDALNLGNNQWALSSQLCGIHCTGLAGEDYPILKENGVSMVWSPLSNLLLYGQTAEVRAAKESGLLIGLGSDWSPSGSKNLLAELKIARLFSQVNGGIFSDRELVAMATRNAAEILRWQDFLGSLEAGKKADLLVIDGRRGDPYNRLLTSTEASVSLVVIGGVPRYGRPRLMQAFGEVSEKWTVGRRQRLLNLKQESGDPVVGSLTLRQAVDRLKAGLSQLPELARNLESPRAGFGFSAPGENQWFLLLDHEEMAGESQRPHFPFGPGGVETGQIAVAAAAQPLSQVLAPGVLDPLTVVDDPAYLSRLLDQINLPVEIRQGLPGLFGG